MEEFQLGAKSELHDFSYEYSNFERIRTEVNTVTNTN
jgi:hypothetical protein